MTAPGHSSGHGHVGEAPSRREPAVPRPVASLPQVWTSHPAVHQGAPVFLHTTVPLEALWKYRRAGVPLYEFLLDFPEVRKAHARRLWAWLEGRSAAQVHHALVEAKAAAAPGSQPPPRS